MANDKVGRNDPCPCGSGRKFKQCCANKAEGRSHLGMYALLVALMAIAAVVVYNVTGDRDQGPAREWHGDHWGPH